VVQAVKDLGHPGGGDGAVDALDALATTELGLREAGLGDWVKVVHAARADLLDGLTVDCARAARRYLSALHHRVQHIQPPFNVHRQGHSCCTREAGDLRVVVVWTGSAPTTQRNSATVQVIAQAQQGVQRNLGANS
jgi:hypothetical protein